MPRGRPGSTGSATSVAARATGHRLLAVGLLAVGFAFKVSAVPFHMWTPDAYEGAPTIVTAFMSTGVKAAAFGAFVRVFLSPLEPLQAQWIPVLSAIAGATMILGTVVGVVQTNIKRMLAYSSIAHAGYLLLGIAALKAGAGEANSQVISACFSLDRLRHHQHRRLHGDHRLQQLHRCRGDA